MRVEITAAARREFEQERAYYEEQRPGLGEAFAKVVQDTLELIGEHPLAFQKVPRSRARRAVCKRFPFKVTYLVLEQTVRIIAIAPHKRRPLYWRERS